MLLRRSSEFGVPPKVRGLLENEPRPPPRGELCPLFDDPQGNRDHVVPGMILGRDQYPENYSSL
jgi:hypothetical protein